MTREELVALAETQDKPQNTPEWYSPNDFYGIATALKSYAGVHPGYAIKATIQHGGALSGVWDLDMDYPLPAHICFSHYRCQYNKPHTSKVCKAIGPYIQYVRPHLDEERLEAERKRLGRNLLVFPLHSTHRVVNSFDPDEHFAHVREVARHFDSVRVCLFWKDILTGLAEHYLAAGFEVVSAGHMFNPLFLPRLKSLLSTASVTMSSLYGTYIPYSVAMGVPHYMHRIEFKHLADGELLARDSGVVNPNPYLDQCFGVFGELSFSVTPAQHAFIDELEGIGITLTPEEMRALFEHLEDLHRADASRLALKGTTAARPALPKRVIALGDSMSAAAPGGQGDDAAMGPWPDCLQAMFAANGVAKDFPVQNLASPGQSALILNEAATRFSAHSAHAVVVALSPAEAAPNLFSLHDQQVLSRLSPQGRETLSRLLAAGGGELLAQAGPRLKLMDLKKEVYALLRDLGGKLGPSVYVTTLPAPPDAPAGVREAAQKVNAFVRGLPASFPSVTVVDLDGLLARHGHQDLYDSAAMTLNTKGQVLLAREIMRKIAAHDG